MRKCFEFSAGVKGKMHELSDGKTILDLCDQGRTEGKTGFLVRAETLEEAQKRLNSITPTPDTIDHFYIL